MKTGSVLFYLAVSAVATAHTLRSGDLIFQTEGSGEFSHAISASTATGLDTAFVHVGIVEVDSAGKCHVIEASTEEGVREIPLSDFIASAPDALFVVKRLQTDFPVPETISNARQYIGQPYDWCYLPDNGMMYCSELVYESYRTTSGDRIFPSKPMNFRASDGSMPSFWENLYRELGQPVPEGVPGTNPNDLAADSRLVTVTIISKSLKD